MGYFGDDIIDYRFLCDYNHTGSYHDEWRPQWMEYERSRNDTAGAALKAKNEIKTRSVATAGFWDMK